MGRYYDGDISGKFWFGVQSSDAADRFGVSGERPQSLDYYYDEANLEDVLEALAEIEANLGDNLEKLQNFFEGRDYYKREDILKVLGVDNKEYDFLVSEYADYILGNKIKDAINKYGQCSFNAGIY